MWSGLPAALSVAVRTAALLLLLLLRPLLLLLLPAEGAVYFHREEGGGNTVRPDVAFRVEEDKEYAGLQGVRQTLPPWCIYSSTKML